VSFCNEVQEKAALKLWRKQFAEKREKNQVVEQGYKDNTF